MCCLLVFSALIALHALGVIKGSQERRAKCSRDDANNCPSAICEAAFLLTSF